MNLFKITAKGLYFTINLKPQQKSNAILKKISGLVAHVKAPATKNKANNELIKLLKENKILAEVVKGRQGRKKLMYVETRNIKQLNYFVDSLKKIS